MLALLLRARVAQKLRTIKCLSTVCFMLCHSACSLSSESFISSESKLDSEDSLSRFSDRNRALLGATDVFEPDLLEKKSKKTDKTQEQKFEEFSSAWLYGHGMGRSMLNIGTVIIFPPYAIYLLGNAGLQLAGYDQLHLSSLLPVPAEEIFSGAYNGLTSVPGRISANIAGREFDDSLAKEVKVETSVTLQSKP